MPQVSRIPLPKEVAQRISQIFIKSLIRLDSSPKVVTFVSDLLTPTEKIMLTKRLTIAFLLTKGYSYDLIKDLLKVSPGTVASVQMKLRLGGEGYRQVVRQLLTDEVIEKFFHKLEDIAVTFLPESHKGSGIWREVKQRHRQKRKQEVSF